VQGYEPSDLDRLIAAGEVVWLGVEPLGERDGRVALYLTDHLRLLRAPGAGAETQTDLEQRIVSQLGTSGASFFPALLGGIGGGCPQEVIGTLWDLVWRGVVTNDTLHALRALVGPDERSTRSGRAAFRSRREMPRTALGRWSLVADRVQGHPSSTEWATA